MGFFKLFRETANLPEYKPLKYTSLAIAAIGGIIMFAIQSKKSEKFVPYLGKVVSFYTETTMHGGTYCQIINVSNKKKELVNKYSSLIDGHKTRFIDFIAIGDSVVCNAWDTINIYKNKDEIYKFVYNPNDR